MASKAYPVFNAILCMCSVVKVVSEASVQKKTFEFPVGKGSPGYKDQHMYLTSKAFYLSNQTSMKVYNQLKKHLQ